MVRKDGKPIQTTHDRHNPDEPPHGPKLLLSRYTSSYGGRDEVRVININSETKSVIFVHIPDAPDRRDVMDTKEFFSAYVPVLLEDDEREGTITGPRPRIRNTPRRSQPAY